VTDRLVVRDLDAGYGRLQILRNVSLDVAAGEFVAVLGANGAGKTTLLRAISRSEARTMRGSVVLDGHDIGTLSTEAIVRRGLLHVPEGRRLFTELTVDDNLRLGGFLRKKPEVELAVGEVYERFPALAARKGAIAFGLSGGEQQMLAIGRALVAKPSLLMLDEPSTGLAPRVVESIFAIIASLRAEGTSILLVEQNARLTLRYADRAYVLEHGSVSLSGSAAELAADPRVQAIYLGANVAASVTPEASA
jgi:branched-chain amino acid transport system ATP-binding protein